ncbi:ABC transporter ATP-binding protein [Oceanobacillus saliphilus]|uniref:ABC transporter ATP-binding protein n=1 Tax=Oceanobacillus saliphilus TaxID=2925834 RepID=UPI00201DA79B|nr:ATP-binding cassette domain-containing protein [Oceanobacillus saliphilus]
MENKNNQPASQEDVIVAENIGVSFEDSRYRDDIKSLAFGMFKGRKEKKEPVWPLKDIDFTGHQGEILGIIGSNGAGKTTLSKIIAGILQEDKGNIKVDGKVTALFSFGMGFNKELTGRENVYLNGMMLGINKELINHYIDEIHDFSDIGDFIDQPMKYYSSGMKARLGFSVAAHLEPEILILDEALNTGDAKFSRRAAEKMKVLVKQAKMVIIVTHSLRYAERNCDRLMWIDGGHVREIGDPKEVVEHYKATVPAAPPRKKRSLQLNKTETDIKDRTIVKAENVGVSFELNSGTFWALKDVNFEIKEGEVVGIIGHNGAGKSTLCKVLTNILRPDEGNIELKGETSSLLGYGTGFNAQLSGRDNVYLNAMLLGIPKKRIESKFDEIVEFSGLNKAIDKPVKQYSSGMKSRLGFSIAAILKPDIFIIDEALSTGDMAFQQKASERIQDMMEHAKAVIIVSHSMNFVEKVCTRGIWMERGQVRFDGTAEEAVAKYRESLGINNKKPNPRSKIINKRKATEKE